MCNQRNCGGNDYCCATWCEYYDGDKPCTIKHQIYGMNTGWLTFLTRDAEGDPIQDWVDLTAGQMTWEMWYAKRPQYGHNTDMGNTIMATYADNHNTNAFSSANRRRNIGVYIQPGTGKLSLGVFIGENAHVDPDPDDPYAGAHVMFGPAITDNDWHHIAVVWNRTEGKGWLHLDGQRHHDHVTYEPGDDNPGLDGKLVIGGGHLGRSSTCQVSQFRLWKVGLHQHELQKIMQCGEPALPITDLKGFYRLSGDLDNSAPYSGFLPLVWEKEQGVFAEGNPCEIGPPGFKGHDAFGGPPGPQGVIGMPGDEGQASSEWGPPGPPGPNGTKGKTGDAPPPPHSLFTEASWTDFYIVFSLCIVATGLSMFCIRWFFIEEKTWGDLKERICGRRKIKDADDGYEDHGENWEGEGYEY